MIKPPKYYWYLYQQLLLFIMFSVIMVILFVFLKWWVALIIIFFVSFPYVIVYLFLNPDFIDMFKIATFTIQMKNSKEGRTYALADSVVEFINKFQARAVVYQDKKGRYLGQILDSMGRKNGKE